MCGHAVRFPEQPVLLREDDEEHTEGVGVVRHHVSDVAGRRDRRLRY